MGKVDVGNLEGVTLPDRFTLSHSGGSGFNVSAVWDCPRKAALKLLGWKNKLKPMYFITGGIVHQHAFHPYLGQGDVNPAGARQRIETVISTEKYTEEYTNSQGEVKTVTSDVELTDKDRADAPTSVENMLTVWDQCKYHPGQVVACERLVISPVLDPDTGNAPGICDGIQFAGRLDLAINKGDGVSLRDLKTAASAIKPGWLSDVGYTMQLSSYSYLWAAKTGEKLKDLGLFPLVKNKTVAGIAKHAVEMVLDQSFSWQHVYEALVTTVEQIKTYEKRKFWPQCHPSQCVGRFGQVCQFAPLCYSDQFPEGEWAKTLVRKDEG